MSETKTKYVSRSKRWQDANESVLIESTDGSDFFDAGNGQGRSDGRFTLVASTRLRLGVVRRVMSRV